jgi:hypothetical protein
MKMPRISAESAVTHVRDDGFEVAYDMQSIACIVWEEEGSCANFRTRISPEKFSQGDSRHYYIYLSLVKSRDQQLRVHPIVTYSNFEQEEL